MPQFTVSHLQDDRLEEILKRWPDWTVDLDNAVRASTATVRGWDSMPTVLG